ncbi:MAG: hypothetical protein AABX54_02570 [Nanoarchaeota archaeon]
MTDTNAEQGLIKLIATDRIEIPISSMSGKLKRQKPEIAREVACGFNVRYNGERVYARVVEDDKMKARGMKEGIESFKEQYPKYGQILQELIDEERASREKHLYFGMKDECRITADDYREVMTNLGFTPAMAEELYPALMDVSRKLSRQRGEERSILIG